MPARPVQTSPATGSGLPDSIARRFAQPGTVPEVAILLPNLTYFTKVPARLLRAYPKDRLKVGDMVTVELFPNGCFYLSGPNGIVDLDATDGVDFDFTGQRL